jgi:hypothetical protein
MNKKEFNVIREEFSRAVMIQQARKMLNEASFGTFMTELRKYEENTIITESIQSGTYYDNFFSGMSEQNILLEAAPEMPPEVEEEEEKAEAPEAEEGAPEGGEPEAKPEGGPSREEIEKEIGERLRIKASAEARWKGYSQKAQRTLLMLGSDVTGGIVGEAEFIIKNKDKFEGGDEVEAIAKLQVYYGKEDFAALFNEDGTRKANDPAKDKLAQETADQGGDKTVKERGGKGGDAGKAEKALDDAGEGMDTPKSQGIFGAIKDNYLKAFQFMPALLGAGIRKLNQIGRAQPRNQDDLLLQLLIMLLNKSGQGGGEEVAKKAQQDNEDKTEEPIQGNDNEGGDSEGGEGKPHKVADLQDKIILTLNKVLDTKNVDMSRKDTMELAKKITKNLVDQMLANGIQFKGMEAQIAEAVYNTLENRNILLEVDDGEGNVEGDPKKEKPENDRVQKLIKMRVKRFTRNPANFLSALKKVRREFAEKEYGKKDVFKQYINSDVEQEFVGLYDAYLDIMALGKAHKILKKQAKEDENVARALEKIDKQMIWIASKKAPMRKISSLVVHFANFYKLASDDNQAPDHPAQLKKYAAWKKRAVRQEKGGKDAKDMYKPEKVPDANLPQGKKGEINVKNLIFQALKGMEITGDQAKDIESLLNKRLQSVAKQYIEKGMEIRVLEAKLNRYTNSIIKELKNAM